MRTMAATKFKAQCLAVMNEVQSKREPVTVTKNGKPMVKMVPLDLPDDVDPLEAFRFPGTIKITGDIMSPIHTDEEYEEFYRQSLENNR